MHKRVPSVSPTRSPSRKHRDKKSKPTTKPTKHNNRNNILRFDRGDSIWYFFTNQTFSGRKKGSDAKSVAPGTVIETSTDGRVRIDFRYQDKRGNSKWKKNPKRIAVWLNMNSSALSHRLPSNEKMLNPAIFSKKYSSKKNKSLSWWERDKQESLIEEKKKELIAIEKQQREAMEEEERKKRQEIQNERNLLDMLDDLHNKFGQVQTLLDQCKKLDELPNCLLVSKKVFNEARKEKHLVVHGPGTNEYWGAATSFQTDIVERFTTIATDTGEMLRHMTYLQRVQHTKHITMLDEAECATDWNVDEWSAMDASVPALQPISMFLKTISNPSQSNASQVRLRKGMFCMISILRGISSPASQEPFSSQITQALMFGGMTSVGVKHINKEFKLGVSPSKMSQKLNPINTSQQKYATPTSFELIFDPTDEELIMLKMISDNFGDAVQGGKYANGTTTGIIKLSRKDLYETFAIFLDTCKTEEIDIAFAGLETCEDLGATPEVDTVLKMYSAQNTVAAAALHNVVASCDNPGQIRTNIYEYVQARNTSFTTSQRFRTSRHKQNGVVDGILTSNAIEPSSFWQCEEEEVVGVLHRGSHWTRTAKNWSWGFDNFTNLTMGANMDRFTHITYKDMNEKKHRLIKDITDSNIIMKQNGDCAVSMRHFRLQLMHRKFWTDSNNHPDVIQWKDPIDSVPPTSPIPSNKNGDVIHWRFDGASDGIPYNVGAKKGSHLVGSGMSLEAEVILLEKIDTGSLLVTIDGSAATQVTAHSYKPYYPILGDIHDAKHNIYEHVSCDGGLFHFAMAANKRSNEEHASTLYLLASRWRLTEGQIQFFVNSGKYDEGLIEKASLCLGIRLKMENVYRESCSTNGTTPTPMGQLKFMDDLCDRSAAWNELMDIVNDFEKTQLLRAGCRSANINAIMVAVGALTEMFAAVGAIDYFRLGTQILIRQKSMSEKEYALQAESLTNEEGGKHYPDDLLCEQMHYLTNAATGKKHGLVSYIASTQRAMLELPKRFPGFGASNGAKSEPKGSLYGININIRIAYNIEKYLDESGIGDLRVGAILKHTGRPVMDDPNSSVVYNFANQRIPKAAKNKEDVYRVAARNSWNNQLVFNNHCIDVHFSLGKKRFDRTKTEANEALATSYINMATRGDYNNLVDKPNKSVWIEQSQVLFLAAQKGSFNPGTAIINIGKLRTSGPGSQADKKILREFVVPSSANLDLFVRTLCRFKSKNRGWTVRVLNAHYSKEGTDFLGLLQQIASGAQGASHRRRAATLQAETRLPSLKYKEAAPTSRVEQCGNELLAFLNNTDLSCRPLPSDKKLNIAPYQYKQTFGYRGAQKPLPESAILVSNETARLYMKMERDARNRTSRRREMEHRRKKKNEECQEMVLKRRAEIEARQIAASPSRWKQADGSEHKIPITFIHQSIAQAKREAMRSKAAEKEAMEKELEQKKKEEEAKAEKKRKKEQAVRDKNADVAAKKTAKKTAKKKAAAKVLATKKEKQLQKQRQKQEKLMEVEAAQEKIRQRISENKKNAALKRKRKKDEEAEERQKEFQAKKKKREQNEARRLQKSKKK